MDVIYFNKYNTIVFFYTAVSCSFFTYLHIYLLRIVPIVIIIIIIIIITIITPNQSY